MSKWAETNLETNISDADKSRKYVLKTAQGRLYLLCAGECGGGRRGLHAADRLRRRAGRALRLVAVMMFGRQTLTAAVLLKGVRVLLLGELAMVYCKKRPRSILDM